ncbi:MAG: hypothetical protein HY866_13090, partial [Chloroflexi bacterium]|nr:hypothetical protein [Chloroflexota bacterium]
MMQIHCENCGTIVPAANINIQEKLAVCPQCGSVFSFAAHLTRKAPLRKLKRPSKIAVIEEENTLEIGFRWLEILKFEEHWFTLLCAAGTLLMGSLAVTLFSHMDSLVEAA